MITRLSPSQLGTFLRCQLQWKFRYLDGIIALPNLKLLRGKGFGQGVAADATMKKDTGSPMTEEAVADTTRDATQNAIQEATGTTGIDTSNDNFSAGEAVDHAVKAATIYHRQEMPNINPLEVEAKTEFEIRDGDGESIAILGYADIEEADKVIENKLVARKSPISKWIPQVVAYNIGFKKPGWIKQAVAYKSKTFEVHTEYVPAPKEIVAAVAKRFIAGKKAMEAGNYVPTGDTGVCNYCGYNKMCPYSLATEK